MTSRLLRAGMAAALSTVCATGCDDDGPSTTIPGTAPSCPARAERAPEDYIPGDAIALFSVRVDEVVDFEREVVGDSVIEDAGYDVVLEALTACGLRRETFRSFTAAFSEDEEMVGIVEGEGLGDATKLQCLAEELGREELLAGWSVQQHGCDVRFVMDGETVGFVAGPDVLVFASEGWMGHARATSLGAEPHPPRKLVRGLRAHKTAAFGGDLKPCTDDLVAVPVLGGLQTITGYLDLDGGGFELDVEGSYGSNELADASAHELESLRRRGKLLAPQLGIPAKLLDRVKIRQRGREVRLNIDLSDRDVQRIAQAVLDDGKSV